VAQSCAGPITLAGFGLSVFTGETAGLENKVSAELLQIADTAHAIKAALQSEIANVIADLQPEEAAAFTGRLAGMIAYEVAEAVVLNVAGGAIKAGKLPKMIAALEKLPGVDPAKLDKVIIKVKEEAFTIIVNMTRKTKRFNTTAELKIFAQGSSGRKIFRESIKFIPDFPAGVGKEAHHIFPVDLFDTPVGKKLTKWGINLIGDENGIWLPTTHWEGRKIALHIGKHTDDYADYVHDLLEDAKTKEEALGILNQLKEELTEGLLTLNKHN